MHLEQSERVTRNDNIKVRNRWNAFEAKNQRCHPIDLNFLFRACANARVLLPKLLNFLETPDEAG